MLKFFMFMLVIHILCVCGMFGPIFCISIHLHLFTNHLICLHIKGVTGSLPTCHIWFFLLDFWPLFFMKLYVHIYMHNTHILKFWFLKICFPLLFSPFCALRILSILVVVQSLSRVGSLWPYQRQHARLPCPSLSLHIETK